MDRVGNAAASAGVGIATGAVGAASIALSFKYGIKPATTAQLVRSARNPAIIGALLGGAAGVGASLVDPNRASNAAKWAGFGAAGLGGLGTLGGLALLPYISKNGGNWPGRMIAGSGPPFAALGATMGFAMGYVALTDP